MVYYRKYRPQQIDDLDNAEVREKLLSVLTHQPPHAFLFTGPKGLGKTSTARIVAKSVNCERRTENGERRVEPCNSCEPCVSITNGTNMDVLEIDAASNRGIDEIRELKEKIRLAPLSATKKVYIIDEVHMLTTEAFNALLKTLEEPPEHALFVLCTTESHKIPATILSRCTHIHFHLATKEELVRSFTRITKGEHVDIDNAALEMIADLSEGGFRDGAKILEEIVALSHGEKITTVVIESKYNVSQISSSVSALLQSLVKKDAKAGIAVIGTLVSQGIDLRNVVQEILKSLHEALLVQMGVSSAQKQSVQLSLPMIQQLFVLFSQVSIDMKTSVIPQLPLELAVISYCQLPDVIASEAKQSQEADNPDRHAPLAMTDTDSGVSVSTLRKQVGAIKKREALYGVAKPAAKDEKETVKTTNIELQHVPDGEITKEWLDTLWQSIIVEMKKHNHTIAGVLRGCIIKQYDTKKLVIQANYKFHKEKLDEGKIKDTLIQVCKLLTGKDVLIEVELKK